MLRLSRLADYAIVLMTYCADPQALRTARSLATAARLPLPTVSKVLKALGRAGLVASQRGARGGYHLARPAAAISVVDIIAAIEGPIALTACSLTAPSRCELEAACPVRSSWQRLNAEVVQALARLSLVDMQRPSTVMARGLPKAANDGPQREKAL